MIEILKPIFMTIGISTVGFMIYVVVCEIINKFNRWRKNGCKIEKVIGVLPITNRICYGKVDKENR